MRFRLPILTALATLLAGTANAQTDMVCVAPMGTGGPFCLDSASSWGGFEGKNKPPVIGLRHVAMCGGKLALAGYRDVAIRERDGWAKLDRTDKPPISAFACDAGGVPTVGHREGIARFQNGQWVETANAALGVENANLDHARGFVTTPDGTLWAVLGRGLAQWVDGGWKRLAEAPPFANPHVRLSAATADAKGNIWATHSTGVAMYDGKKWTDYKESLSSPESVVVDANGDVWIAAYDGLRVLSNGAWKKPAIAGLAPPVRVREIRADTRGRLWATTSWGLAIIENGAARFQRIANSDIPGDDLRGLLVSGAGPKSLTIVADKPLGSLKGKIEGPDNTGISGARVEICNARLSSMTSFKRNETPCTNQAPLAYDTKTAKDGSFLFEKVPPGEYSLVVEGGSGKWVLLTGSFTGCGAERIRVGAGKPTSVPTVTLKAKP